MAVNGVVHGGTWWQMVTDGMVYAYVVPVRRVLKNAVVAKRPGNINHKSNGLYTSKHN